MNQNMDHYDYSLKFSLSKLITKDCSSMSLFLIDNISQAFERMELYIFTFVRFLYIIHITRGKEKCKYCCNI